ncbi:hypothetical protein V6N11_047226, partial [Hibiscus sabdariffa]
YGVWFAKIMARPLSDIMNGVKITECRMSSHCQFSLGYLRLQDIDSKFWLCLIRRGELKLVVFQFLGR